MFQCCALLNLNEGQFGGYIDFKNYRSDYMFQQAILMEIPAPEYLKINQAITLSVNISIAFVTQSNTLTFTYE